MYVCSKCVLFISWNLYLTNNWHLIYLAIYIYIYIVFLMGHLMFCRNLMKHFHGVRSPFFLADRMCNELLLVRVVFVVQVIIWRRRSAIICGSLSVFIGPRWGVGILIGISVAFSRYCICSLFFLVREVGCLLYHLYYSCFLVLLFLLLLERWFLLRM